MVRNNINTPEYYVTDDKNDAIKYIQENWNKTQYGYVFKVDQFSKNSFERTAVPDDLENAIQDIHRLFNSTPNAKLIIEKKYFIFIKWIMLPLNRRSMHFCGFL